MKADKLTKFMLATLLVLLFWNVLMSTGQIVHATSSRQYQVVLANDGTMESTLNQAGHDGWDLKYAERVGSSQHNLILEREQ